MNKLQTFPVSFLTSTLSQIKIVFLFAPVWSIRSQRSLLQGSISFHFYYLKLSSSFSFQYPPQFLAFSYFVQDLVLSTKLSHVPISLLRLHQSIIIIFINCNLVITRWQWLYYMYTNMERKSN